MFSRITSARWLLTKSSKCRRTNAFISSALSSVPTVHLRSRRSYSSGDRSFEPVIETDVGVLAELRREAPPPHKPAKFAGAGARHDEPGTGDGAVLDRPLVLEDERPRAPAEPPGHSLDPDEACLALAERRLEELGNTRSCDLSGELLFHVDAEQCGPVGRLVVRARLIDLDVDSSAGVCAFPRCRHRSLLVSFTFPAERALRFCESCGRSYSLRLGQASGASRVRGPVSRRFGGYAPAWSEAHRTSPQGEPRLE